MPLTEKDAKEIGVDPQLVKDWEKLMNLLWSVLSQYQDVRQGDNVILIGDYQVGGYFMNNSYIEVKVQEGEEDILTVRHRSYTQTVHTVVQFLKYQK